MIGYIYLTTNLINNKIYVGKRKLTRFSTYYKGGGAILKQAFKKYGRENFSCIMIDTAETHEELCEKEKYWIAYYKSQDPVIGYNIANGGEGTPGYHHSAEAKKKMHNAKIGKSQTPEWIANNKAANIGKHKMSDELKQHLRDINLGHTVSEETRRKISEANKGHKPTEETKAKLRANSARRGKHCTEEEKEFLRQLHLGKPKSEEHRKKLSESRVSNKVAAGAKNPRAKKVYCFETDTVYSWPGEAAELLGVSINSIRLICQGKQRATKGFHFKWYEENNTKKSA